MNVTGAEIRKIREQLGEDQTTFGARFGVHRRTVIRWEKSAARWFTEYGSWNRPDRKPEADLWREVVKLAAWREVVKLAATKSAPRKNSKRKSTTALAARKPKTARRRKSARKAVTAKRRRGSVARRRSVAKATRIKKPGRKK